MVRVSSFLLALFAVATCLRSSITGVGPLLGSIRADLGLTATAAGVLSSLPLLMFAVGAPASRFARNHGTERMLFGALLVLLAGILIRSEGQLAALYGGTVIIAGGIAVANILLPVLVKQHFPDRVATITTGYATIMGVSATLGSAFGAPLADWLPGGWRSSLVSWAVPVVIALLLWIPHTRHDLHVTPASGEAPPKLPWRSSVAWQVTGYMGLQSLMFYVTVAWYPTMLRDDGYSVQSIAGLLTVYQVSALAGGLLVPYLVHRGPDQRLLAASVGVLSAIATLGVQCFPQAIWLWMVVMGVGTGPALILALSFMGLRAANPRSAAALSLMAQSLGYLLSAAGPVTFGFLHDVVGGWSASLLFTTAAAVGMAICGYGAGRAVRE
jgi:CP family cyanate transporter-like MFS transporter